MGRSSHVKWGSVCACVVAAVFITGCPGTYGAKFSVSPASRPMDKQFADSVWNCVEATLKPLAFTCSYERDMRCVDSSRRPYYSASASVSRNGEEEMWVTVLQADARDKLCPAAAELQNALRIRFGRDHVTLIAGEAACENLK